MAEQASTDLTGSILAGRYRILRKLGEGAMGAVYLGEHLKIGRQDAIKVLRDALSADAEAIARFNRGARNVAAIRHPNVCTIYDYSDTDDGTQFLAMQFVPGESLKDVLDREGVLPVTRAAEIARQTADALQAAHDAGIVHRDLKPANIMISAGRAGDDVVTVVDFDIAKGSQEGEQSEVTRLGFVVGTPEYMSPEQLTGDRLDGRSDVYSLALVLFRMITGALPFEAESAQDLMIKRLTQDPLRLDQVSPGATFPAGLQPLFDRALARKASDRLPDAASFAAELVSAVPEAFGHGGARHATVHGAAREEVIPATRVARPVRADEPAGPESSGGSPALARRPAVLAGAGVGVVVLGALAFFALRGPSGGENGGAGAAGRPLADAGAALVDAGPPATDAAGASTSAPAESEPPTGAASNSGAAGSDAGGSTSGGTDAPASTGTNTPPPAPPPPPPPPRAVSVPLERVNETLWRQFEMLGPPDPPAATLRAIRDTADAIWRTESADAADRAMAAYVAGSAWLALGDAAACATWLERAVQLRPDGPGYSTMLDNCRRQLR